MSDTGLTSSWLDVSSRHRWPGSVVRSSGARMRTSRVTPTAPCPTRTLGGWAWDVQAATHYAGWTAGDGRARRATGTDSPKDTRPGRDAPRTRPEYDDIVRRRRRRSRPRRARHLPLIGRRRRGGGRSSDWLRTRTTRAGQDCVIPARALPDHGCNCRHGLVARRMGCGCRAAPGSSGRSSAETPADSIAVFQLEESVEVVGRRRSHLLSGSTVRRAAGNDALSWRAVPDTLPPRIAAAEAVDAARACWCRFRSR